MKSLIFGLVFLGLGIGVTVYFDRLANAVDENEDLQSKKAYEDKLRINHIKQMVNGAVSVEDLSHAEYEIGFLPDSSDKEKVQAYIALKMAKAYFNQAEDALREAIEINNAIADETQGEQPLHPLTQKTLEKAFDLWERARKEAEKLKDDRDPDYNYHLNYLKGEIYYRLLEFLSDPDTKHEMFDQTVTYYKFALRNRPSDVNTVVNIELLIKNQNALLANASDPKAKKRQMLNSKKYGIGKSSGN